MWPTPNVWGSVSSVIIAVPVIALDKQRLEVVIRMDERQARDSSGPWRLVVTKVYARRWLARRRFHAWRKACRKQLEPTGPLSKTGINGVALTLDPQDRGTTQVIK